jgi:hypothetical protein
MAPSRDRVVPTKEISSGDRSALGWAVSSGHPLGTDVVERVRHGGTEVTVGELAVIRRDWERAGRPNPEHHVHRTRVCFQDGTAVTAVTFSADDPYSREAVPSFGLYLDERWKPPWPHSHIAWPDLGLPTHVDALRHALLELIVRAKEGGSVEIGCLGGHGRTGTALACLAVLTGTPPVEATEWVRANYCRKAVETDAQEELVRSFTP